MKPAYYLDIEVLSIDCLPDMSMLALVLHGIQRERPGLFALAFPKLRKGEQRHPGNTIRVFAETSDSLYLVAGLLQANARLRGQVEFRAVRAVPSDFAGGWIEYRRVRLPGKGSRLTESRAKMFALAASLPLLRTVSKTNGQGFSLFIDAIPSSRTDTCDPDSYGLSVSTRAFGLPAF